MAKRKDCPLRFLLPLLLAGCCMTEQEVYRAELEAHRWHYAVVVEDGEEYYVFFDRYDQPVGPWIRKN